jgi:xylulokinase
MQWLRTNEPEHFARPVVWADVGSRLLEALTGRSVTCRAGADTTGMIELVGGDWSEAVLGRAGLARSSLPGLVGPGEVVGPLLPDAARELGLDPGTPVVAAGGDGQVFATCALGGRLDPSACTLTLGTSVVLALPSLTSTTSPLYRTLRAARPGGGWLQEAVIQSGTYLARWLERLSGVAVADSLESVASGLPPGSAGLLCVPNWWGARFPESHPQARGATLGWADHHNAAHLYRSLVEGVAFELRYLLGEMQGHGPPPRRVVVGGGAADSPLWRSVLRDVLGLDMDVAAPEAVTLGAALLAAVGCGAFGTLEQASDRFPSAQETTSPDTAAHTMYERLFQEVYLPFRQVSTTLSARLAHLTAGT